MKIIGMVHLDPLLGYPNCDLDKVMEHALADAKALEAGGVDSILVENCYDDPHKKVSGPETVATMAIIVKKIVEEIKLPMGVCVLFNSYKEALAIAKAAGASFVRIPVFTEAVVTACGIIEGKPYDAIAFRKRIGAENIKIYADVHVKHAVQLAARPIEESASAALDCGAEGIIITGRFTGNMPLITDLEKVKKANPAALILIGSGTTPENIKELAKYADAAIVGTYFKENGRVQREKVERLIKINKEVKS